MSDEGVSSVGARQLRHELSSILDRVWDGESFEITDRGKPVARLVPLRERESPYDRLIADGKITPARRSPHPLPKPVRIRNPRMTSDQAIAYQRDESPRLP